MDYKFMTYKLKNTHEKKITTLYYCLKMYSNKCS